MPSERMPFGDFLESGEEPLAGASPSAINVLVGKGGYMRRRPGISAYSEAPSSSIDADGIDGLYESLRTKELLATSNKKIYKVGGGSSIDLSFDASSSLAGQERPVFAETDAIVVIASGSDPQKVNLATATSSRLGGTPPTSTHIVPNASRLVSNQVVDSGRIRYSGLAGGTSTTGHETWPASNIIPVSGRPDPVAAMGENVREIWSFGAATTQVYQPDATYAYTPVGLIEHGILAPYSVIRMDDQFAWLDQRRRFVQAAGRQAQVISQAIGRVLDDLDHPEDCFGYRVKRGQHDLLVWAFPTDGYTFCQQVGGGWSQWNGWTTAAANWQLFPVNAHVKRISDNADVVGLSSGRIAKLDYDANTDLGDEINAHVETGYQNHGTLARKQCVSVKMVFQGVTDTSNPAGMLSFRDDEGAWSSPIPMYFGATSSGDPIAEVRSLGVYRMRQWRFRFSGSAELVLARAEEEFEILPN